MELLQEAAELIVSEAGIHPSYRCLILMQPENFFEEWTEKSRDEVLDKLSDHVTVCARLGSPACFSARTWGLVYCIRHLLLFVGLDVHQHQY